MEEFASTYVDPKHHRLGANNGNKTWAKALLYKEFGQHRKALRRKRECPAHVEE